MTSGRAAPRWLRCSCPPRGGRCSASSGSSLAVSLGTALPEREVLLAENLENLIRRTALFGILSIGAGFVIITGGIDLSIGSVVALAGCMLPWLLSVQHWPASLAVPVLLGISSASGSRTGCSSRSSGSSRSW